jgi:hypothetical protein
MKVPHIDECQDPAVGACLGKSDPIVPLEQTIALLQASISDAEWRLKQIESQHGWFRFPGFVAQSIVNLKLES